MKWKLLICGVDPPFFVEVDPENWSVAYLKEFIRYKLRITSDDWQNSTLWFGEQQLTNATTLVNVPNLQNGSTLILSYPPSWGMMQFNIEDVARRTVTSVTISFNPVDTFTIRLAKAVEVSTNISACQQKLFYNGKLLSQYDRDSPKVPPNGSTITLFQCTTWYLHVKIRDYGSTARPTTESSFSLTIPHPQNVSIMFLKGLIEKKTALPPRKQVLYSQMCDSCMGPCNDQASMVRIKQPDHYPLCESHLMDGATVIVKRFHGWHLHIKKMDGSTTMVTIDKPMEVTIMELKQMCSSTGVPPPEQRLMTSDHEILEDIWVDKDKKVHQKRLKRYPQVGDESVIHLVRLTKKRVKIILSDQVQFYFTVPQEVQCVADLKEPVEQMLKYGILCVCGTYYAARQDDEVYAHYEYCIEH